MKIKTRLNLNTFISVGTFFLILLSLTWSFRTMYIADQDMELVDEIRKVAFERILLRDEYLLRQEERSKIQWRIKSEDLRNLFVVADAHFNLKQDKDLLQNAQKDFEATFSLFSGVIEGRIQQETEKTNTIAFSDSELRQISQVFFKAYTMTDSINRLHKSAQSKAKSALDSGATLIVLFFLGGIFAIIINSEVIRRTLTKRITILKKGVETIGAGNLDYRIAVEGDDELTTLALASNAMAAELKGTFTSIENLENEIFLRTHSEEELRKTSAYLENLINSANAPIIVWDPQFRIIRFNQAFEKMTGKTEAEVLGQSLEILFPYDLIETSMDRIRTTLSGERLESVEINIRHTKGSVRTVLWNSATLFATDGETPLATIAQGQDITKRKQAETRLASTIEELQRSNKELEQFAYVASHDLQEPLRMVTSYTQLLAERYQDQLDDKAKKFIHYAVDGAVRMQLLINDLLIYSRVGTKGKPLEPTDSHAVLGEALNILRIFIDEAKAIITHDELPEVNADASQLVQLFQNLIGNAVKFRGEESPHVHVSARDQGQEWLFSVRDNGIGIDLQYADKVFVIFQRLHARDEYPGSGIGLAICKKIVERHGGRIWFESEPGKGTTFYFTFPK
jgi:PAS domain S-box-containing protein